MNKKLVIVGTGGHAKVCLSIAEKMGRWQELGFLSDDSSITQFMGHEVMGPLSSMNQFSESDLFVAIGDPTKRKTLLSQIDDVGRIISLLDPSAIISPDVVIGRGSVIMPGVVINTGTQIGEGCIINTSATLDHDNTVGDFSHLSPSAHTAGTVTIGDNVWIGTGGIVINNIRICSDVIIGAGTVVIKDIHYPGVYVGNPARKVTKKKEPDR